jgi:CheY-like chemotaxis protein
MSNSLKFTPENGKIKVKAVFVETTRAYTSDRIELYKGEMVDATRRGELKVCVTDTGVGMTESQIRMLFKEGVQFSSNQYQSGGGSGLGLFICQGLVKQHKGTISATSDGLGKGSTFSITLPLWGVPLYKQASNAGKRAPNTCSEDTVDTHSSNSLRILVVDDVYSNRRLLRRILENKGHVCLEAENGRIAVDMVKAAVDAGEPFDTCCIDYEMPVMDGPTACREIRDLGINVNIIGVTGNALPEDISYFISLGANEVTTKPVKIAELESLWVAHGIYKKLRSNDEAPS